MKKFSTLFALVLAMSLLAGCAGTPVVYYTDCTCPPATHETPAPAPTEAPAPAVTETPVTAEGALKTGLAIVTDISGSTSATAEGNGKVKYDVTIAAVTLDDAGVIRSCIIDAVGTEAVFDASGAIITDLSLSFPQTKNELGEAYGMKAYAGSKYEWNEQAAALAEYAVGKTVEELKNGAVNESGYAADADLATTATIAIGGYVSAIEKAAMNAQNLGAQTGDTLKLAVNNRVDGITSNTEDSSTELITDVAALTMNGDTITSCYIDSLQAKVSFNDSGEITSDISSGVQTKNELGENYGMVAWAGAVAEWDQQAASFAAYVTCKTVEEVKGIAVNESTKPTDADLASSVTIAIGGFQALIAKAAQ